MSVSIILTIGFSMSTVNKEPQSVTIKNHMQTRKTITVIGGGTGTSVALSGLKQYQEMCDLNAIVAVSDSGGSTGRLRDEFGFLPVGDLRQCLAALASGKHQQLVRELLLYRFEKGNGLQGHNLGNLILTALEDLANTPAQAIEQASNIFRIKGRVYPVSEDTVDLEIHYQSGKKLVGEHSLDDPANGGQKITQIKLKPPTKIYHKAATAIKEADLVMLGPGDLYASLLPNTLAEGFVKALTANKGKFVYVVNLMTHYAQTHNYTAKDHLSEVEKYTGRKPDFVIINNGNIPKTLIKEYEKAKEYQVIDDLSEDDYQVIRADLVSKVKVHQLANDLVPRSLLRHDSQKLAKEIINLL